MKVRKTVDLDRDGINITIMFQRQLEKSHAPETTAYKNNMEAFEVMLQEVADKAFTLGMKTQGGAQ